MQNLMQNQSPISQLHGRDYQKLNGELEMGPLMELPSDAVVQKFNFEKNYAVVLTDREDWDEGSPIVAQSIWYTDGPKTEEGVEARIFVQKSRI